MDKKIMDYRLVKSPYPSKEESATPFAEQVSCWIKSGEGWQPYGSLFVNEEGKDTQAMVRYE